MDKETLASAGQLLLGSEWQRPLARYLGPHHPAGARESLDPRLVQRWASGERPVPAWVPGVLAEMLSFRVEEYHYRAKQCQELVRKLRALAEANDRLRPGA